MYIYIYIQIYGLDEEPQLGPTFVSNPESVDASLSGPYMYMLHMMCLDLQSSQNDGSILRSQTREYRHYRIHYFGHVGGPDKQSK